MRRLVGFAFGAGFLAACFSFGDLSGGGVSGASDGSTSDVAAGDDGGIVGEGGGCGDTTSSAANCGACGQACKPGVACVDSVCGDRVDQVAAGDSFDGPTGCALLHDGTVWCWGGGASDGLMPSDAGIAPVKVPGAEHGVALAMGSDHACILTDDAGVACWGQNTFGQLGRVVAADADCPRSPRCDKANPVSIIGGESVQRLYVSQDFTCVYTTGKHVDCWGQGINAAVEQVDGGAPLSNYGNYQPTQLLTMPADVTDLEMTAQCGCRSQPSGISCWGDNDYGQLGHDTGTDGDIQPALTVNPYPGTTINFFPAFGNGATIEKVFLAAQRGCALAAGSHALGCWGSGGGTPTLAEGLVGVSLVAVANDVTIAENEDGVAFAWGTNANGVLGLGVLDTASCAAGRCDSPTKSALPDHVKSVAVRGFGVALTQDDKVVAWGPNAHGQLGHAPGTGGDFANCLKASDAGVGDGVPCNPVPSAVVGLP